jgi:hypothetical protein
MYRAQDYKTKIGDLSQISTIWLAEMVTSRHFSQSDFGDLRLVSRFSFMILGTDCLGEYIPTYPLPLYNNVVCKCTEENKTLVAKSVSRLIVRNVTFVNTKQSNWKQYNYLCFLSYVPFYINTPTTHKTSSENSSFFKPYGHVIKL